MVKWSNPGEGVASSPKTSVLLLLKRDPSSCPRLQSPTIACNTQGNFERYFRKKIHLHLCGGGAVFLSVYMKIWMKFKQLILMSTDSNVCICNFLLTSSHTYKCIRNTLK